MKGTLVEIWDHLGGDLWNQLAGYDGPGGAAPDDLFSDLFTAADGFLSPRPTAAELEEASNDPHRAQERFLALRGTDFSSESAMVGSSRTSTM